MIKPKTIARRNPQADKRIADLGARHIPYALTVGNVGITITNNKTYAPGKLAEYFHTLVTKEYPDLIKPHHRVLDYGTGSGVFAIMAALLDADVTAVDIVPEALECAEHNALENGAIDKIDFKLSNGFNEIRDEKFDVILALMPQDDISETPHGLERSFYDPNFKMRDDLVDALDHNLNPGGKILMGYIDSAEQLNPIRHVFPFAKVTRIGRIKDCSIYSIERRLG